MSSVYLVIVPDRVFFLPQWDTEEQVNWMGTTFKLDWSHSVISSFRLAAVFISIPAPGNMVLSPRRLLNEDDSCYDFGMMMEEEQKKQIVK